MSTFDRIVTWLQRVVGVRRARPQSEDEEIYFATCGEFISDRPGKTS